MTTQLERAFKGIDPFANRRRNRRQTARMLSAVGRVHRNDDSVRRGKDPEAPTTRVRPRATSSYAPREEDAKHPKRR